MWKMSSRDAAPTLPATVALSTTTTTIISTSLTPAAKAAERRPAMKTKAIASAAAMSVAATVDRSEPSVRRTMSPG